MSGVPQPAKITLPGHNPVVLEWLDKALADFETAVREFQVSQRPHYGAVCFHAQQAVEKQMKGLLIWRGTMPPKIHDLVELDRLLRSVAPGWVWPIDQMRRLTVGAVEYRYPGHSASHAEAEEALRVCGAIWNELAKLF